MAAVSTYWGDEVWGPRYIVPAAWTLLVPIAWWAGTVTRQKVVAGVAVAAIFVQVIGVSAQYAHYTDVVRQMTGVPIYRDRLGVDREKIPYGNDPTRWIPELSALLVQTEGLISSQIVEPPRRPRPRGDLRALRGPQPHGQPLRPALEDAARLLVVPAARTQVAGARPRPASSWRSPSAPPAGSMWCHSAAGGPGARRRPPQPDEPARRHRGLDRDALPQRGGDDQAVHRGWPRKGSSGPAPAARS